MSEQPSIATTFINAKVLSKISRDWIVLSTISPKLSIEGVFSVGMIIVSGIYVIQGQGFSDLFSAPQLLHTNFKYIFNLEGLGATGVEGKNIVLFMACSERSNVSNLAWLVMVACRG